MAALLKVDPAEWVEAVAGQEDLITDVRVALPKELRQEHDELARRINAAITPDDSRPRQRHVAGCGIASSGMSHAFTIGVEEEFQIVDPETWELRSHVTELLAAARPRARRSDQARAAPVDRRGRHAHLRERHRAARRDLPHPPRARARRPSAPGSRSPPRAPIPSRTGRIRSSLPASATTASSRSSSSSRDRCSSSASTSTSPSPTRRR